MKTNACQREEWSSRAQIQCIERVSPRGSLKNKEDWQTTEEEGSKEEDRQEGMIFQCPLHQLLVCPLLYFLLRLLFVILLLPEEDESSKALVCYCFPVFRHIGEYIFFDLFHQV